jgi:glycosyltransferase involved in cell wall biosynthesis
VRSSDYPDWEHIIIDGGSNGGTLDIVKEYPHIQ